MGKRLVKTTRKIGSAGYASVAVDRTRSGSTAAPSTSTSSTSAVAAENKLLEEKNKAIIAAAGEQTTVTAKLETPTQTGISDVESMKTQQVIKKRVADQYKENIKAQQRRARLNTVLEEEARKNTQPTEEQKRFAKDFFEKNPGSNVLNYKTKTGTIRFTRETVPYGTLTPASEETKAVMRREKAFEKVVGTQNYTAILSSQEEARKGVSGSTVGKIITYVPKKAEEQADIAQQKSEAYLKEKLVKGDVKKWSVGSVAYSVAVVPGIVARTTLVDYPIYATPYAAAKFGAETVVSGGKNIFDIGYKVYDVTRRPTPETITTYGSIAGIIAAPTIAKRAGAALLEPSTSGPKVTYDLAPQAGAIPISQRIKTGRYSIAPKPQPTSKPTVLGLIEDKSGRLRPGRPGQRISKAAQQKASRGMISQPPRTSAKVQEATLIENRQAIARQYQIERKLPRKGGKETTAVVLYTGGRTVVTSEKTLYKKAAGQKFKFTQKTTGEGKEVSLIPVRREGSIPKKVDRLYSQVAAKEQKLDVTHYDKATGTIQVVGNKQMLLLAKKVKAKPVSVKQNVPSQRPGFEQQLEKAGVTEKQYLRYLKESKSSEQLKAQEYQKGGFRKGMREKLAAKLQAKAASIKSQREITPLYESQKATPTAPEVGKTAFERVTDVFSRKKKQKLPTVYPEAQYAGRLPPSKETIIDRGQVIPTYQYQTGQGFSLAPITLYNQRQNVYPASGQINVQSPIISNAQIETPSSSQVQAPNVLLSESVLSSQKSEVRPVAGYETRVNFTVLPASSQVSRSAPKSETQTRITPKISEATKQTQVTETKVDTISKTTGGGGGRGGGGRRPAPPEPITILQPPTRPRTERQQERIREEIIEKPKRKPVLLSTKPVLSEEEKRGRGFDVFVRRRGKFKKINVKPLSEKEALQFGASTVKRTSAATFKIKPSYGRIGQRFKGDETNIYAFTRKSGLYIQPKRKSITFRGGRISSLGEKREITFKGIRTPKKRKSLWQ